MMYVYKSCCGNCLLSPDAIVSPARRKDIIQGCVKKQTHFICHKASMDGKEILCKTFFDKLGHHSQMIRIAERLNMVAFVDHTNHDRLVSYKETQEAKSK